MSNNLSIDHPLKSMPSDKSSTSELLKESMEEKTILFIGNYRPTIPLIHEFHKLGFTIIVGITDASERGYAASRFISEKWFHSNPDDDPNKFIHELNQLLKDREDITYVLPVAEDMLVLLQAQLSNLYRPAAYVMVASDLINLCLNKAKILEFADQATIEQAPFKIVSDYQSLIEGAKDLNFPIAVRPTHSSLKFGSRKALLCKNLDQLKSFLPSWPEGHEVLILQKQFKGRRHNLYFAAQEGEVFRLLETVADRTDHADGTGLAVMGRTIEISPYLRQDTEALLKKMNYTGIGCAQFLVCKETHTHSFLEINPRIAGNHMLPTKAGLSLGPLLLALTKNEDIPSLKCKEMIIAEPGITYVWTYGDLGGCLRELKNKHISITSAIKWIMLAMRDALIADMHMTWSWQDPWPSIAGYKEKAFGSFSKKLDLTPRTETLPLRKQR